MLINTLIYSFSVLALYELIRMYSESLTDTSRNKCDLRYHFLVFLTVNFFSKISSQDYARIYFSVRKENMIFKVLFLFLFNLIARVSFLQK